MTNLADWLRAESARRGLTQNAVALYAGVGQATISDILSKGHIPRAETLFRLSDFFDAPRERVLRLAGYLPSDVDEDSSKSDDYLVPELVDLFRRVPDEWKPEALAQMRILVRLANQPPMRIIGEEVLGSAETGIQEDAQAGSQAA